MAKTTHILRTTSTGVENTRIGRTLGGCLLASLIVVTSGLMMLHPEVVHIAPGCASWYLFPKLYVRHGPFTTHPSQYPLAEVPRN